MKTVSARSQNCSKTSPIEVMCKEGVIKRTVSGLCEHQREQFHTYLIKMEDNSLIYFQYKPLHEEDIFEFVPFEPGLRVQAYSRKPVQNLFHAAVILLGEDNEQEGYISHELSNNRILHSPKIFTEKGKHYLQYKELILQ